MAVVGIDLGTTNTVVGMVGAGEATTLRNDDGGALIPSVVSFHPSGKVLVGRAARDRRLTDAANTIYSIKRLIGRSWNSEEVARARKRFPFEMREGPGQAALAVARGETFTLPEISAFVLRHAKTMAENALGESVERAVITVPANFNDLQRAATKVAGRVAGLEVLRILNEPTAAALAYGYGKAKGERIAIYDFGGGTFDVTLLDLSGNVFEVLATAGNTFLGGDDIDLAIAERMAEALLSEHGIDARENGQIFERLRVAAESLKVALSVSNEHTEHVDDLAPETRRRSVDFSFSMTRGDLDSLASPIVEQTFEVCREALGIARLDPDDFDQVVLVGGSTRLPLVSQRVREFFGRSPLDRISPDEVVAIGAAIQANALTGPERRRSTIPKPPMPAARTTESSVGPNPALSRKPPPPPLPRQRKTDPFGHPSSPRPSRAQMPTMLGVGPSREETQGRRRRTTGMGLGPAPPQPPGRAQPKLPLPRNKKGGTLSGVGDASAPPRKPGAEAAREDARLSAKEAPQSGSDEMGRPSDASAPDRPALSVLAVGPDGKPSGEPLDTPDVGSAEDLEALLQQFEAEEDDPTIIESLAPYAPADSRATDLTDADVDVADASNAVPQVANGKAEPESLHPEALQSDRPAPAPSPERVGPAALGSDAQHPEPALEPQLPSVRPAAAPQESFGALPALGALPPSEQPAGADPFSAAFEPAAPAPHQIGLDETQAAHAPLPLLVDVTPLSLSVETVGGYCDVIIARNTPVPCEQSRTFVTVQDDQTQVAVRVGQGDCASFSENTLLGELLLEGLPPGPRGQAKVIVTFALDTDGILSVRASDAATGREASARLQLVGMPSADDLDSMMEKHGAHPVVS